MTDAARTLRAVRGLETALRNAASESRLAYTFNANSYSFAAMSACVALERALEALRQALADEDFQARCQQGRDGK